MPSFVIRQSRLLFGGITLADLPTRCLRSFLFAVQPTDQFALVGSSVIFGVVAWSLVSTHGHRDPPAPWNDTAPEKQFGHSSGKVTKEDSPDSVRIDDTKLPRSTMMELCRFENWPTPGPSVETLRRGAIRE